MDSATSSGGDDATSSSSGGGSGSSTGSSSGSSSGSGSGGSSGSGSGGASGSGSGGDSGGCSTGTTMCSGQCVDTLTDPSHCGNCQTMCDGPCNAGHCSGFTSLYSGAVWQADTRIAVGSNGYVAAVWQGSSDPMSATSVVAASISTDPGSTWSPVQSIKGPNPSATASLPALAVDAANNFYLAFETFNTNESHIYSMKAPAGTTTFGTLSEVTDPAQVTPGDAGVPLYWPNLPTIAVTQSQEIVVTHALGEWKTCGSSSWANTCVANLVAARSTDGQSWTRSQVTANSDGSGPDGGVPDAVNWATMCTSATTGRLWGVYDQFGAATHGLGIVVQYSDDDGATWSTPTVVMPPTSTDVSFDSPSCAGNGSDVWVEFEVHGTASPLATSIWVAHSTDGGQTFGLPKNVMDPSASHLGWHATLVRDSSGHLEVEYYGGSTDGDPSAGVYFVQSKDDGATWGTATRIRAPITLADYDGTTWTDAWLGYHIGVTTGAGSLYTTFADNSSGVSHVDFAKVALP